jgi:hypothetical protein
MKVALTNARSALDVEQFLSAISGVRSARVVGSDSGGIEEIHVLCAPSLQPKQVVRNIESALCAGLGIRIDRRVVSVAQLREEFADAESGDVDAEPFPPAAPCPADVGPVHVDTLQVHPSPQAPAAEGPEHATPETASAHAPSAAPFAGGDAPAEQGSYRPARFDFVGFDAAVENGRAQCEVRVRRGHTQFSGGASGANTALGRAAAAAEALLRAMAAALPQSQVTLEGVAITQVGGRPHALVSAFGVQGRATTRLTGLASMLRSPEEAAILAALQAANRWTESR